MQYGYSPQYLKCIEEYELLSVGRKIQHLLSEARKLRHFLRRLRPTGTAHHTQSQPPDHTSTHQPPTAQTRTAAHKSLSPDRDETTAGTSGVPSQRRAQPDRKVTSDAIYRQRWQFQTPSIGEDRHYISGTMPSRHLASANVGEGSEGLILK